MLQHVLYRGPANDLAFSGGPVAGPSAATPLWVDRSTLDTPTQLGMIGAGHAPAGYESATQSA